MTQAKSYLSAPQPAKSIKCLSLLPNPQLRPVYRFSQKLDRLAVGFVVNGGRGCCSCQSVMSVWLFSRSMGHLDLYTSGGRVTELDSRAVGQKLSSRADDTGSHEADVNDGVSPQFRSLG